jgi:hypothetical protein
VPANLVASYLHLRTAGRAADAARPGIFSFLIAGMLTCADFLSASLIQAPRNPRESFFRNSSPDLA